MWVGPVVWSLLVLLLVCGRGGECVLVGPPSAPHAPNNHPLPAAVQQIRSGQPVLPNGCRKVCEDENAVHVGKPGSPRRSFLCSLERYCKGTQCKTCFDSTTKYGCLLQHEPCALQCRLHPQMARDALLLEERGLPQMGIPPRSARLQAVVYIRHLQVPSCKTLGTDFHPAPRDTFPAPIHVYESAMTKVRDLSLSDSEEAPEMEEDPSLSTEAGEEGESDLGEGDVEEETEDDSEVAPQGAAEEAQQDGSSSVPDGGEGVGLSWWPL